MHQLLIPFLFCLFKRTPASKKQVSASGWFKVIAKVNLFIYFRNFTMPKQGSSRVGDLVDAGLLERQVSQMVSNKHTFTQLGCHPAAKRPCAICFDSDGNASWWLIYYYYYNAIYRYHRYTSHVNDYSIVHQYYHYHLLLLRHRHRLWCNVNSVDGWALEVE